MNENELGIWTLQADGTVEAVKAVNRVDLEDRLEEMLVRRPDMLERGIRLVGRQTPAGSGALDLLGVDQNGCLVVFELKRDRLTREAVAQCIDYASALDAMGPEALAEHIAKYSGHGGIEKIDNFEEWYEELFDEDRLLPLRLVLVGIGVDEHAERMARFLQAGGIKISVLTFYSFRHGDETLLARQVEIEAATESDSPSNSRRSRYKSADERRQDLERRLHKNGTTDLFDRIQQDITTVLAGSQNTGPYGVTFNLRGSRHKICRIGVEDNKTPIKLDVPTNEQIYGTASLGQIVKIAETAGWHPLDDGRQFGITIQNAEDWGQKRAAVIEFLKEAVDLRRKAPAADAP